MIKSILQFKWIIIFIFSVLLIIIFISIFSIMSNDKILIVTGDVWNVCVYKDNKVLKFFTCLRYEKTDTGIAFYQIGGENIYFLRDSDNLSCEIWLKDEVKE
jgi:hypothetical protein